MSLSPTRQTVIDLLDSWLQGDLTEKRVKLLTIEDFDEFADRLDEHYQITDVPSDSSDLFYSGGWAAGNWGGGEGREYLYSSCLYYPQVVVHDPLAEWLFLRSNRLASPGALRTALGQMTITSSEVDFLGSSGYQAQRSDISRVQAEFVARMTQIDSLRALIESGVVQMISPWHIVLERQQSILTAIRHDVRDDRMYEFVSRNLESLPKSDRVRGMAFLPEGGWDRRDARRAIIQDPSYFYNKTLAIADAVGAKYIPPASSDAALLELKLEGLKSSLALNDVDLRVIPGVVTTDLPFLHNLTPEILIKIRENETAFDDWRRGLRTAIRTVHNMPSAGADFEYEAAQVLSDSLIPVANEVAQLVKRSPYLKKVAGESLLSMGTAAAATVAVQHLMKVPSPDVTAVPIALSTGALSWLFRSVFGRSGPEQLIGSKAVMATLIQKR